jgi:SAM-dependent methyltransferase
MLGMHLAGAYPAPTRWLYRVFGFPNIHDRQRWAFLWPHLQEFRGRPVRALDVGCGSGNWVLELAARNPAWTVTGIDRNSDLIRRAEQRRVELGIGNARFVAADCLDCESPGVFDLVLSVNSAHYALPSGDGPAQFQRFREWLDPGGTLILLAPWCVAERHKRQESGDPLEPARGFFSTSQVLRLCARAGLEVKRFEPCIGRWGILAKELALDTQGKRLLGAAVYPAQLFLSFLDRRLRAGFPESAAMLLTATPIARPGSAAGKSRTEPFAEHR